MPIFFLLFSLLTGCATKGPWQVDAIATGDPRYDSSRLFYQPQDHFSPMQLELIRTREEISSFLSLTHFTFRPSTTDPLRVKARFTIGQKIFEASLPLLEGKMRLKVPPSILELLISSLQEGEEVSILIDGRKEVFLSSYFTKAYDKWRGKTPLLHNLVKGPID